jgi:transcriptional antiterminator RfaH
MSRWYVAQTQSRGEMRALVNLTRQGFSAYLPQYLKRRRHARKTDWVRAPLFPRYIFINLDPAAARWRAIGSTIGIAHLICAEDRPLAVPDGVVEDIRARETDAGVVAVDEAPPFAKDQAVRVTAGPLAELVGLFEGMTDSERVTVLFDMLGRQTRVRLPANDLAAFA